MQLTSAPRLVWQQDPAQSAELPKTPIGLSDLAFDPNSQSIYLTTSFENAASSTADSVAGYLWRLDLAALGTNAPAELVRNADGSPLTFTHKAEGVLPGPNSITVLHDDDKRVTTVTTGGETRAKLPNEAAFDLVPMRWDSTHRRGSAGPRGPAGLHRCVPDGAAIPRPRVGSVRYLHRVVSRLQRNLPRSSPHVNLPSEAIAAPALATRAPHVAEIASAPSTGSKPAEIF